MNVIPTELSGVLIIEPRVFADERGFFKETYHSDRYAEAGIGLPFVQDNISRSSRGTLRGLHFQVEHAQGKLVQVIEGQILDVAVDIRRDSPTFGQSIAVELSSENHRQIYIPPGFAHGFSVQSDTADMHYKCTDLYSPQHERTLLWNDPALGIDWKLTGPPVLSAKDAAGTPLEELECYVTDPAPLTH